MCKVKTNPDLVGGDRQFSITGSPIHEKMLVHTDHKTQMDYLLELEELDDEVELHNKQMKEIDGEDCIVAIQGEIPVGYLGLKSSKRSNNNLSSTVSKPSAVAKNDFSWAE